MAVFAVPPADPPPPPVPPSSSRPTTAKYFLAADNEHRQLLQLLYRRCETLTVCWYHGRRARNYPGLQPKHRPCHIGCGLRTVAEATAFPAATPANPTPAAAATAAAAAATTDTGEAATTSVPPEYRRPNNFAECLAGSSPGHGHGLSDQPIAVAVGRRGVGTAQGSGRKEGTFNVQTRRPKQSCSGERVLLTLWFRQLVPLTNQPAPAPGEKIKKNQRAFRQRKEGYIKKLEEQVRDFTTMQESYKQIQSENFQLRDYIINIQSRLIESQGEDAVPPPPPVFLHPAPPIMLLDTSQATSPAQASSQAAGSQPSVSPPGQLAQAVSAQPLQIPQHAAVSVPTAPTASMQPQQSVLQVSQQRVSLAGTPTNTTTTTTTQAATPNQQQAVLCEIAAAGQKRAHEDAADQAFLQRLAQAAGVNNGFVPPLQAAVAVAPPQSPQKQQQQQQQQQQAAGKTTSPAAKRVKGEMLEAQAQAQAQAEAEMVNGA